MVTGNESPVSDQVGICVDHTANQETQPLFSPNEIDHSNNSQAPSEASTTKSNGTLSNTITPTSVIPPRNNNDTPLGYVYMALSSLGFSANAMFVHYGSFRYQFPVTTAVLIRSILQAGLSGLVLFCIPSNRMTLMTLTSAQLRLLVFRGVTGTLALMSLYTALGLIPVGDSVAIFFLGPAFTFAFSHLFVGEPFTLVDATAIVISLVGAVLIARPDDSQAIVGSTNTSISSAQHLAGSLYTLLSAAVSGVAYTTIRYLGSSVHYMTSIFSFGFFAIMGSVLMGGYMSPSRLSQNAEGAFYILLGSICAFFGQVFLNKGLQRCRAGPGLLIRNIEVPFAYLAGIWLLNEKPSWLHTLGATLIVFSTLFIGARELFLR